MFSLLNEKRIDFFLFLLYCYIVIVIKFDLNVSPITRH